MLVGHRLAFARDLQSGWLRFCVTLHDISLGGPGLRAR
jgi:hypothetical protein